MQNMSDHINKEAYVCYDAHSGQLEPFITFGTIETF